MKKIKETKEIINEEIIDSDMSDVLSSAFNRYAKEVISDRAIPDARDGLKPVQRRIIFDMFSQGQLNSKPTVKSATIVGHVMGHLHPHGDSSIYDALVHMSQAWKMEAPLISFQGNNGSIDDDPAAAYRYTEAKLSSLAEYLCMDLNKNVVKMLPTFDDKSLEPSVLPARFPNLLINGTQGIAVGSTTYIPPHNLAEVIDATIYRIHHKRCNLDEILQFIKGPDFPTGGIIDDVSSLRTLYETGHGNFYLYCKTIIDESSNSIIIKEIPFGVVKISFVALLNKRKETDKLDNIEEIIDESANEDISIVIKVKQGANPSDILNYLQSKGVLRTTISCNFLAIDHSHPRCLPLLDLLDSFIDHQRDVSSKAYVFDLKTAQDRLEIVNGYIKCYSILDEIITKIKACSGKEGVKKMLMTDYSFSERQSEAIAMMPLYRLSNTDIIALREENEQLLKTIEEIENILANNDLLDNSIINILKNIKKQFSTDRKTEIVSAKQTFESVDTTKLIAKEEVYVALTYDGYVKRTNLKSYNLTLRNNNKDLDPLNLPKLKPGDHLVFNSKCDTHQGILFFTNLANYGYVPIYELSDIKWKDEGKHINNLVKLQNGEKIIKAFKVEEFKDGLFVVMLFANNKVKRTSLSEYKQELLTKKTLKAAKLSSKDDHVVDVCITSGNSDVIVMDSLGRVSRYNENEIASTNIVSQGIKAISNSYENSPLVSLVSLNSDEVSLLLCLSSQRAVRLFNSKNIPSTNRLQEKTKLIKVLKNKPYNIIGLYKIEKKSGQQSLFSCVTNESTYIIDLSNLSTIDLNCEMRENITCNSKKESILFLNENGSSISKNTKTEVGVPHKVEVTKKIEDKGTKQLSIWEMFGNKE